METWTTEYLPTQSNLDGSGEAGCEQVSGEVRDHGQELMCLTGCQLDAVFHRRRQGHLGKWMVWINRSYLQEDTERQQLS